MKLIEIGNCLPDNKPGAIIEATPEELRSLSDNLLYKDVSIEDSKCTSLNNSRYVIELVKTAVESCINKYAMMTTPLTLATVEERTRMTFLIREGNKWLQIYSPANVVPFNEDVVKKIVQKLTKDYQ